MLRRTQGGASLCPGLSHFDPLGRGNEKNPIVRGLSPDFFHLLESVAVIHFRYDTDHGYLNRVA